MIRAKDLSKLPKLIVFDLDHCLWTPEMYILNEIPTKQVIGPLGSHGEGVIGVVSGREVIRLFPDALLILQEIYLGNYEDIKIAAASSADTPQAVRIGKAAMNMLEILPGVTMKEVFARLWPDNFEGNLQIGRSPPLSSDKSRTHFPILKEVTKISYSEMIFFDDCGWSDNCAMVEQHCSGVITQKTPNGITIDEWNKALLKYSTTYSSKK